MAPAKLGHGFDLEAHDAPEVRTAWRGRPVAFYAGRLNARGQRLLPLAEPLPLGVGLEARLVVRVEGFNYRPGPSGRSLTEIAGLEVVRFDLEGIAPAVASQARAS